MWRRICSERNILICLYLTIFLLPLSSWLFTLPLFRRHCFLWGYILHEAEGQLWRQVGMVWRGLFSLLVFICFRCGRLLFSIFNWCFLPLAYAFLYVLISTYFAGEEEKRKALYVFLAGAVCVVIWGFIQYADAGCMARGLDAGAGWIPNGFLF